MPTFTTIALETLLEPRIRDSYAKKPFDSNQQQHDNKPVAGVEKEEGEDGTRRMMMKPPAPNHIFIKPALYVTPEQTPIPDSSSDSLSPSPYVVNHKRRGGDAANRRIDGFQLPEQQQSPEGEVNSNLSLNFKVDEEENGGESPIENLVDDNFSGNEVNGEGNEGFAAEEDDFADPRFDSLSVASSEGMNDFGRQVENRSVVSNQGEFFDADDDFSSDGSISNIPSCGPSIESELRATRLSLLEEIERRKIAEDAVGLMHSQWQRISCLLSQDGLSFPTPKSSGNMQLDISPLEQLSQEVVVARFVAEAIGKGLARAEAELVAEAIIESKDQEISRLRDRLQYYEAVNHEMSQRNQEVMEIARRQRRRKKIRRRWVWGGIGLSIVIGVASTIAYSYLPQSSKLSPSPTSSGSSESSGFDSSKHA